MSGGSARASMRTSAEIGSQGMIDHSYFWLPRREGSAMKIKPLRGSEHDAPRSVPMAFGILFIVAA